MEVIAFQALVHNQVLDVVDLAPKPCSYLCKVTKSIHNKFDDPPESGLLLFGKFSFAKSKLKMKYSFIVLIFSTYKSILLFANCSSLLDIKDGFATGVLGVLELNISVELQTLSCAIFSST